MTLEKLNQLLVSEGVLEIEKTPSAEDILEELK